MPALAVSGQPTEAPADVRDLLLHISRELVGADSLDQLLQMMVDAAQRMVPAADKCVIHLLDDAGQMLHPRVCSRPSLLQGGITGMPAGSGVAGRALQSRQVICVDDTAHSADFVRLQSGPELRSLLVAPLYVAETSLGTLSLSSPLAHAFTSEHSSHIRTLAAQASVAIRQAQLLMHAVAERQRSEAIVASMTDGLVILDGTGRIVGLNPALHQMLELDPAKVTLPCAGDAPACPERLRTLLDPSHCQVCGPYELELTLPSSSRATFLVTPAPLLAPARGEIRTVRAVTQERASAEARYVFISQVAHELRRPIQHILGYIDLMTSFDDLGLAERKGFLQQIHIEVHDLTRLVDDLGQLSRIETGRFTVHKDHFRLDEAIGNVVERMRERARDKGISLRLQNAAQPVSAFSDADRLDQVFGNLLDNACKFVPPGGQVTVSVEATTSEVIVRVADSGPGIPADALPYVFERFFQVQEGPRGANQGMGLGLYISREIINSLGGRIWVESEVGRGSTFSVSLPRTGGVSQPW